MGLKQDLVIGGAIVAAIVIFREQIGSGLAKAGGALGGGFAGFGTSFFDALKGAIPQTTVTQTEAGTIESPSDLPVTQTDFGNVTVTDVGGGFQSASGGTPQEQEAALDQFKPTTGEGSFFDQFQKIFSGILGPISGPITAFAETPIFQGPAIDESTGESKIIGPDRPLDLRQFASKLAGQAGLTQQQAQAIVQENPRLAGEIVESGLIDPVTGQPFRLFGPEGVTGSIVTNKPLTDILNIFKKQGIELTASQAANIKATTSPDAQVQDFDFGTNTGSALELAGANFGQEAFGGGVADLELRKAIENFKALKDPVFGGTSNFANPNFPITLGEAFLGKKGTVVSDSIANLEGEDLQRFLAEFA